jgi:hypothetical protein
MFVRSRDCPSANGQFEFSLLGHRCTVIGADRGEEHWLRTNWQFDDSVRRTRPHEITVRFSRESRTVSASRGTPQTTVLHDAALVWQQLGPRWWCTGDADAGVELRMRGQRVAIDVRRRAMLPAAFPVELALRVAMCEALRATGLSPLHAAVIARGGKATALVGSSGAGKSSTLLLATIQDWQPVAEDFAWLDPTTARVFGWDRGIHLTEHALDRMGAHWPFAGWQRGHGEKLFLSYEEIRSSRPADAELTRVAVLHRDPTRPSGWEPLGVHDAVRAWFETVGVPLCRVSRSQLAASIALLLKRVEVLRLVLGNTPISF